MGVGAVANNPLIGITIRLVRCSHNTSACLTRTRTCYSQSTHIHAPHQHTAYAPEQHNAHACVTRLVLLQALREFRQDQSMCTTKNNFLVSGFSLSLSLYLCYQNILRSSSLSNKSRKFEIQFPVQEISPTVCHIQPESIFFVAKSTLSRTDKHFAQILSL